MIKGMIMLGKSHCTHIHTLAFQGSTVFMYIKLHIYQYSQ